MLDKQLQLLWPDVAIDELLQFLGCAVQQTLQASGSGQDELSDILFSEPSER